MKVKSRSNAKNRVKDLSYSRQTVRPRIEHKFQNEFESKQLQKVLATEPIIKQAHVQPPVDLLAETQRQKQQHGFIVQILRKQILSLRKSLARKRQECEQQRRLIEQLHKYSETRVLPAPQSRDPGLQTLARLSLNRQFSFSLNMCQVTRLNQEQDLYLVRKKEEARRPGFDKNVEAIKSFSLEIDQINQRANRLLSAISKTHPAKPEERARVLRILKPA